jgi:7-cyano-7-deazaguanine synthase in queuosine biosynthesis
MDKNTEAINLFWTGGWDSTFRLLQLLLKYKEVVQPYYALDPDRRSTAAELYAMRNIKRRLFTRFPDAKDLLLKTIYFDIVDISPNPAITDSLKQFQEKYYIGIGVQYDWLARFCNEKAIQGVELGIAGVVKPGKNGEMSVTELGKPWDSLHAMMTSSSKGSDRVYWLDPQYQGEDEYTVFHYYRFPLWELTKKDMREISRKEGLDDIMALTWFCHNPMPSYIPCGTCVPCSVAIQDGMGWRIPWTGKLRYYTNIKGLIHKNSKLYSSLQTIKLKLFSRSSHQSTF